MVMTPALVPHVIVTPISCCLDSWHHQVAAWQTHRSLGGSSPGCQEPGLDKLRTRTSCLRGSRWWSCLFQLDTGWLWFDHVTGGKGMPVSWHMSILLAKHIVVTLIDVNMYAYIGQWGQYHHQNHHLHSTLRFFYSSWSSLSLLWSSSSVRGGGTSIDKQNCWRRLPKGTGHG